MSSDKRSTTGSSFHTQFHSAQKLRKDKKNTNYIHIAPSLSSVNKTLDFMEESSGSLAHERNIPTSRWDVPRPISKLPLMMNLKVTTHIWTHHITVTTTEQLHRTFMTSCTPTDSLRHPAKTGQMTIHGNPSRYITWMISKSEEFLHGSRMKGMQMASHIRSNFL
jgi:hypothetical protein